MHVFFYEAFEEEADAIRSFLPEQIEAGFHKGTIEEAGHDEPPAPIVSVRTQSYVPAAWDGRIQAVLSRSTGYDHLRDLRQRFTHPVGLGYLPLYCHTSVAEQALLGILALARRLPRQLDHFGRFERDGLTGMELLDRTVAVFGVGNIGSEVARICSGIGMRVLGVDLAEAHPGITYVSAEVACARADVVVVAMDLTDANAGYFGPERLATLKRGCLFVNVSRGELSPSTALLAALESGRLGGVVLDVYTHERTLAEPLRAGAEPTHPEARAALALSRRDDALCTPHNAFNTTASVLRKSEHSVLQVVDWVEQGRFRWAAPVDAG